MRSSSKYKTTGCDASARRGRCAGSEPEAATAARPSRRIRRAQGGQALIIAIAVLFLLAFLAALFITLLSKNLERVQRSSAVLTADFYAQAGIRYADQMLTTSPQGADWRPPMKYYLADQYVTLNPDANAAAGVNGPFTIATTPAATLSTAEQQGYLAYANNATGNSRLVRVNPNDPDKFWLEQGFTRYSAQGGRYLVRLTYGSGAAADPYLQDSSAPTGKFIRIESVGRTGVIDDSNPSDPTVFTGAAQPTRLNSTLIAYKPIGLTDYARFITNRDQRSDTFALGVPSRYNTDTTAPATSIITPGVSDFVEETGTTNAYDLVQYPLVTTYGYYTSAAGGANYGGSLRCNGSLRLYGMNVAFLDNTKGDDWEVSGDLTFDGYQSGSVATDPTALQVVSPATVADATPSNANAYDTLGGLIRDGGSGSDANGYARNIQRLNPPAIDAPAPGDGQVEHYAALTNNGTNLGGTDQGPYVAETPNGPATVYIDNTGDEQPESTSAQAGSTLRDDWLSPEKNINGYWHGPYYDPPGATVVFGPQYLSLNGGTIAARWGFTVTRSDAPVGLDTESHVTWRWNGDTLSAPLTAPTCTFVYGSAPQGFVYSASNPIFFIGADDVPQAQVTSTNANGTKPQSVDNDIVIYAEGNLRVRGTVSPTGTATSTPADPDEVAIPDPTNGANTLSLRASPHHVTLVTNQIAYVEGSLLKGGSFSSNSGQAQSIGLSSIAVLARRYVAVNTTQFLAGAVQHSDLAQQQVDASPGGTGTTGALDFGSDGSLTESFDQAEPYGTDQGGTGSPAPALFVSQYSSGSGTENSSGLLRLVETAFDGATSNYTQVTTLDGTPPAGSNQTTPPTLAGSSATPNRVIVPLQYNATDAPFSTNYSYPNRPMLGYDHFDLTFAKSPSSVADYELAKAAVLPSDVHIEAILYAQDNSFFVIPGEWFNDDASDTLAAYAASNQANTGQPLTRPRPYPAGQMEPNGAASTATGGVTDPQFPYYGQPIDMKITIDGSVCENVPADISDQAAWMLHWGWIPKYHGMPTQNSAVGSPHPQLPTSALEGTGTNALPPSIAANIPAAGLTFVYDLDETNAATMTGYSRLDQFGRPLPFTPNLPVSPDLLYSGQPTGNSLVQ